MNISHSKHKVGKTNLMNERKPQTAVLLSLFVVFIRGCNSMFVDLLRQKIFTFCVFVEVKFQLGSRKIKKFKHEEEARQTLLSVCSRNKKNQSERV